MTISHTSDFAGRCINDTLAGLREGLSRFSGSSRSAVIFALDPKTPLHICDPQNLLRGYEPILHDIYIQNDDWKSASYRRYDRKLFNHIDPVDNLQLDGLISYGGRSGAVYYQMWFTEHHPDMCSVGPTERWLEHSVLRFSHDIANESSLYTGISGSFLREYTSHAVHDYIVDRINLHLGLDSYIRIYQVLESVLGISKTPEEGAVPHGELIFVEPRLLDQVVFIARFQADQQPHLHHHKHIRKLLLSVEDTNNKLVSDGSRILGVCDHNLPEFCLVADFQGKLGFLRLNNDPVCSFEDGSFSSSTHRAKLFEVEEILLDYELDTTTRNSLFQVVSALVHNAETNGFGCTLVIDLENMHMPISGQILDGPINLLDAKRLALAAGLSKTDGALHIGKDIHLHGFACLLDGLHVNSEDRARGARYNSALRFTAIRRDTIVVVVSSDRPVSVIHRGLEVRKRHAYNAFERCSLFPDLLLTWLQSDL
ncbi:DNA integrity scanning protein DisA nucleotide-binding domain protein [Desulfosediminicola flagellatus]|uniref:DNA integrity scanning protein DisA nucleotide-binding domain protein n=1 Tax=Desulfosediminicola flagellatus TaxID=2569541 RepID=UPI0010ABAF2A|nr:DNA integrity scanning protein DisA nucleotide-binding domain protein [Desulfosediminicola flagellatus]